MRLDHVAGPRRKRDVNGCETLPIRLRIHATGYSSDPYGICLAPSRMNPTPTKIKTTAIKIVPRYARSALDDVFAGHGRGFLVETTLAATADTHRCGEAVNAGRADFM